MTDVTSTLKKLTGNKEFQREDHITLYNANITSIDESGITYGTTPDWRAFGEDNDELTREINNEIESKKNVLGKTSIKHSKGAQVTSVDPVVVRGDDVLSAILYNMFKYDLTGDKALLHCMEVTLADKQTDGSYGAFTEDAIVDLKSWGGDVSNLQAPIDLNWKGNKEHGTFNATTKAFTKITEA